MVVAGRRAGGERGRRRIPAGRTAASRRRPRPGRGSGGGKAGVAPPGIAAAAHRPALDFAKARP